MRKMAELLYRYRPGDGYLVIAHHLEPLLSVDKVVVMGGRHRGGAGLAGEPAGQSTPASTSCLPAGQPPGGRRHER